MKIIGAGFGRTGTMSLQYALKKLGFGPSYHFSDVLANPKHIQPWMDAAKGKSVDWKSFLGEYPSGSDYPICCFYKELMLAFPDAKVILTVRDPERWYQSTIETIYTGAAIPLWLQRTIPAYRNLKKMIDMTIWDKIFDGRFEEKDYAIQVFNEWIEEVKRSVPPEKLLVFEVKEGWEPLCKFLGVPVPNEPFPRVNSRAMTKSMYTAAKIVPITLIVGALLWLISLLF